jgi:hypothetical protein
MAFTVNNVIIEARMLVADETQPYRWSDVQMKDKVNEGLHAVFSERPDSYTEIVVGPISDLDSLYDDVPLQPNFKAALIYYVAGNLIATRSSDKSLRVQGREFLTQFNHIVGK